MYKTRIKDHSLPMFIFSSWNFTSQNNSWQTHVTWTRQYLWRRWQWVNKTCQVNMMKRKKVKIEDQSPVEPLIFCMILAKCKAILTVGLIFKPCGYLNHQVEFSASPSWLFHLQGFVSKGMVWMVCVDWCGRDQPSGAIFVVFVGATISGQYFLNVSFYWNVASKWAGLEDLRVWSTYGVQISVVHHQM